MTDKDAIGAWDPLEEKTVASVRVGGVELRPGDTVRLRPKPRGDILDLALAGRTARIVSIEQDYEGRIHVAVTAGDDPGQDFGRLGLPGHRFFFAPEEIEPASQA